MVKSCSLLPQPPFPFVECVILCLTSSCLCCLLPWMAQDTIALPIRNLLIFGLESVSLSPCLGPVLPFSSGSTYSCSLSSQLWEAASRSLIYQADYTKAIFNSLPGKVAALLPHPSVHHFSLGS